MKCRDQRCSCRNLERENFLLYEIHGGFCVEPQSSHFGVDYFQGGGVIEGTAAEVIAVAVIAAIVILGLIATGLYILSVKRKDIDFFARY